MRTTIDPHPRAMVVILMLIAACPLLAQITPSERLTEALALVKEGKPAPAPVRHGTFSGSRTTIRANIQPRWEMKQGIAILKRTLGDQNPRYLVAEIAYSRVPDLTGAHTEAVRIKMAAESLLKASYQRQCAGCTISAAAFH